VRRAELEQRQREDDERDAAFAREAQLDLGTASLAELEVAVRMSVPTLHVLIRIEGSTPRVFLEASSEGEELRLRDWVETSPVARDLLEVVERWNEAA